LHVICFPGKEARVTGVVDTEGGAVIGSGAKTPTNAVMIPTTKKAPPITT